MAVAQKFAGATAYPRVLGVLRPTSPLNITPGAVGRRPQGDSPMRLLLPVVLTALVVLLAAEAAYVANLEIRRVLASLPSHID